MFSYDEAIKSANEFIHRLSVGVHVDDMETRWLIHKMAWYTCVCGWMTEDEARKHRDRFLMMKLHHAVFGLPEISGEQYARECIYLPKKARGEIQLPEFMQAK